MHSGLPEAIYRPMLPTASSPGSRGSMHALSKTLKEVASLHATVDSQAAAIDRLETTICPLEYDF